MAGGTEKGMSRSFESMQPLYGFSNDDIVEFGKTLNDDEKKKILMAYEFYAEMFDPELNAKLKSIKGLFDEK